VPVLSPSDPCRVLRLKPGHKFCLLGRLSTEVGWRYLDTVQVRRLASSPLLCPVPTARCSLGRLIVILACTALSRLCCVAYGFNRAYALMCMHMYADVPCCSGPGGGSRGSRRSAARRRRPACSRSPRRRRPSCRRTPRSQRCLPLSATRGLLRCLSHMFGQRRHRETL